MIVVGAVAAAAVALFVWALVQVRRDRRELLKQWEEDEEASDG